MDVFDDFILMKSHLTPTFPVSFSSSSSPSLSSSSSSSSPVITSSSSSLTTPSSSFSSRPDLFSSRMRMFGQSSPLVPYAVSKHLAGSHSDSNHSPHILGASDQSTYQMDLKKVRLKIPFENRCQPLPRPFPPLAGGQMVNNRDIPLFLDQSALPETYDHRLRRAPEDMTQLSFPSRSMKPDSCLSCEYPNVVLTSSPDAAFGRCHLRFTCTDMPHPTTDMHWCSGIKMTPLLQGL